MYTAGFPRWGMLVMILGLAGAALPAPARAADTAALENLGRLLFDDVSLVNPGSKLQTSCTICHHAPTAEAPGRVFSDNMPRSVLPANQRDVAILTVRNTPALLDVAADSSYYYDGRYDSLQALVADKLTGPMLAWPSDDRARALEQIQALLVNDAGAGGEAPYSEQVKAALDLDVNSLTQEAALDAVSAAITAYIQSLKSTRTSAWDAFAGINRVNPGPAEGETVQTYAGRVIGRIENQTSRQLLKRPEAFSQLALDGFKIFFKTEGEGPIGNCVTCHTPPNFTDGRFHNTGIAGREYEKIHGAGSFAGLRLPAAADASRPVEDFLFIPSADNPNYVDLGHWNFVNLESSPQRLEGESDDAFLARMTGTFKTARLRNIQASAPYMHNGAYPTLEDAVREIVTLSQEAQAGSHPNLAPEYRAMRLTDEHVAPLVAFLEALQDRGRDGFRDMLINVAKPDFEELQSF